MPRVSALTLRARRGLSDPGADYEVRTSREKLVVSPDRFAP
jgi:hypothetical protein